MTLRSMTGFGGAQGEVQNIPVRVEIRSVNHKGLDLKTSLPGSLAPLEAQVARLVRGRLGRGRVEIKVRLGERSASGRSLPVLDMEAARALHAQLTELGEAFSLIDPVRVRDLLMLRELVLRDPGSVSLEEDAWSGVLALVSEALDAHIAERDREGVALAEDLSTRLRKIQAHFAAIEGLLPSCREEYLDRLRERVTEAMARFDLHEIPEERLLQEVVLFAARSDIAEELTRAQTHLTMLLSMIEGHQPAQDGPVGKKLDFYFQELIRETNTTGSKSSSAEIAGHVVEIKGEIDRLREQVLNVA